MKRLIFKLLAVVGRVPETRRNCAKKRSAGCKAQACRLIRLCYDHLLPRQSTGRYLGSVPLSTRALPQTVIGNPSCSSAPVRNLFMCGVGTKGSHLLGISLTFIPDTVLRSVLHEADVGVPDPVAGVLLAATPAVRLRLRQF